LQLRLSKIPVGTGVALIDPAEINPALAFGALELGYDDHDDLANAPFEAYGRHKVDKTLYKIGSTGVRQRYQRHGWPLPGIQVHHDSLEGKPIGDPQLQVLKSLEDRVYYVVVKFPDENYVPIGLPSEAALTLVTPRGVR
jgi:hypothetical protein